jgi:hypothetical protein
MSLNCFHRCHRFHRMRHFFRRHPDLVLAGPVGRVGFSGPPQRVSGPLCSVMSVGSLAAGGAIYKHERLTALKTVCYSKLIIINFDKLRIADNEEILKVCKSNFYAINIALKYIVLLWDILRWTKPLRGSFFSEFPTSLRFMIYFLYCVIFLNFFSQ